MKNTAEPLEVYNLLPYDATIRITYPIDPALPNMAAMTFQQVNAKDTPVDMIMVPRNPRTLYKRVLGLVIRGAVWLWRRA